MDIVGPGAVPAVERVYVSRYHWHKVSLDLHSPDASQQIKAAVARLSAQLSTAVIDLTLAGAISLSDRSSVELRWPTWKPVARSFVATMTSCSKNRLKQTWTILGGTALLPP